MGGTATLGTNLVDSLVESVVDSLRGSLHPEMGVRQHRVYLVKRTWSGGRRGEGVSSTTETEIDPQPLVEQNLFNALEAGGVDDEGTLKVTEVSLTYTEGELTGQPLSDDEEFYYAVRDAHGQGIPERRYVLDAPPKPDRIETIGWILRLRILGPEGC